MKPPIKSVAVPLGGRRARPAGHPEPTEDARVGGLVGPGRRVPLTPARQPQPLYGVGQRLTLVGGGSRWARMGSICRVIAVLPHEGGPYQYRVRSEVESYERIVAETDLGPTP